jgi:hypothetical protein
VPLIEDHSIYSGGQILYESLSVTRPTNLLVAVQQSNIRLPSTHRFSSHDHLSCACPPISFHHSIRPKLFFTKYCISNRLDPTRLDDIAGSASPCKVSFPSCIPSKDSTILHFSSRIPNPLSKSQSPLSQRTFKPPLLASPQHLTPLDAHHRSSLHDGINSRKVTPSTDRDYLETRRQEAAHSNIC